ncbi:MAG: phosphatidate cytidylyltransferase [Fibrobacter sp.]|jgi:phosphatidate cytidylyltransferase|nr:phosphatidate cytidylyltransferase [Fibrobacter sp.]
MSNLKVRILFSLVAIPVVFICLWWNDASRLALMCFIGSVGAWEWARMISKKYEAEPSMKVLAPLTTLALTLAWIFSSGEFFGLPAVPGLVGFILLLVLALYIGVAFVKVNVDSLFPWCCLQLGAPLYLGLWGGLNVFLLGSGHGLEHSYKFILVMTAMWGCDTFAYFVGKAVGKHKMAPQISPKKTWEGAFGGTIFTIIWMCIWAKPVFGFGLEKSILLGIVLAVAGQVGDLLISTLKRWTSTKDSSQIFPGHGGVLDRGDSFLMAAPVIVLLFEFVNGVLA